MNTFTALADPARRRMVEELAAGERTAGQLADLAASEFGLSQPATSRHLRILRDAEVVRSRADGARRVYRIEPDTLQDFDAWLAQFRSLWATALGALDVEVRRGTASTEKERT